MRLHEVNNPKTFVSTNNKGSLGSVLGFNQGKFIGKGTESQPWILLEPSSPQMVKEFIQDNKDLQDGDWVLIVKGSSFIQTRYVENTKRLWRTGFAPDGWLPTSINTDAYSFNMDRTDPDTTPGWDLTGDGTGGIDGDSLFIRSGTTIDDEVEFSLPTSSISIDTDQTAFQIEGLQLGNALNGGELDSDVTVRMEFYNTASDWSFVWSMCNQGTSKNINNLFDNLNMLQESGVAYDANIDIVSDSVFLEVYMDFATGTAFVFKDYEAHPICVYRLGPVLTPSVTPYPVFRLFARTATNNESNEIRFQSIAGLGFLTA